MQMNADAILESFHRHEVEAILIGGMNFLMRHQLALLFFALGIQLAPLRTFTLKVVDEAGAPVEGMPVVMKTGVSRFSGEIPGSSKIKETNASGEVSVSGNADIVSFSIEQPHYYLSSGDYSMEEDFNRRGTVLKKIKNPTAMYAKHVQLTIPADGKSYQYDLMIGDWLPPLGRGTVPDLVFSATAYWNSVNDYDQELTLSFSNPDDGVYPLEIKETGSILRLPKKAPTSGYEAAWHWKHADLSKQALDDKFKTQADRAFFIRVRTTKDQNGLIKGMYGKISHDISFGIRSDRKSMRIEISSYYLNPDGTLNMEFDTSKDLLSVTPFEAVREP